MAGITHARGGERPKPGTLNELYFTALERSLPNALQHRQNGRYVPISHREIDERVRNSARGLRLLGVNRGDRVAILSDNRPEWAIADFACLTSGLIDVPIYPTLTAEQMAHILRDSGAVAIFVSNAALAKKLELVRDKVPALRTVVSFDNTNGHADLTLAELESRGRINEPDGWPEEHRREALSAKPDDLATIIYTSGTTGIPKGVMLTHDNLYSNVVASLRVLPFSGTGHVSLSFLPLSHVFERMAGHYMMFSAGISIAYAESVEAVRANMLEVRPTLLLSVPRIYEKIYGAVRDKAVAGGRAKRMIFLWAQATGIRWANVVLAGGKPGRLLSTQYSLAQKLVFSKLKAATGGRIRYFVSGGAPLDSEINHFFFAAGLMILEGYGLTETSPVIAVNGPEHYRIGPVGRPIDGVEIMIAEDGEVLTRGPHVMRGYYNRPDDTRDAMTADRWFKTGDLGEISEDGFLSITGRKKDLIVTAGGKNIAPTPIEHRMKASKLVAQAVMLGDRRKFPIMLIVPSFEQLESWAKANGLTWKSRAELIGLEKVRSMYDREMNTLLSGLARFEMPKKIALLEHDFTIERGELTPKMSIRRNAVEEHHKSFIDALYEGPGSE